MTAQQRTLSKFRMIRGACVLTAVLSLMLQGSSGGHMLLVEHSRCADHGELVHGDSHQHEAGAVRQVGSLLLPVAPDSGPDEAHGHCSEPSNRRDALVSIGAVRAGIRVPAAQSELRLLRADIAPSTSTLRLAPKTSPPA